jgi:uncharacterized protein YuzE
MEMMEVTYDEEADAMYVRLRSGDFARNERIDDRALLDLDAEGRVLGVEILQASQRFSEGTISHENLQKLLAAT